MLIVESKKCLVPVQDTSSIMEVNEIVGLWNELAKLNHYDQNTLWSNEKPEVFNQFNIEHKNELMKLEGSTIDKLLTEVCWDLN